MLAHELEHANYYLVITYYLLTNIKPHHILRVTNMQRQSSADFDEQMMLAIAASLEGDDDALTPEMMETRTTSEIERLVQVTVEASLEAAAAESPPNTTTPATSVQIHIPASSTISALLQENDWAGAYLLNAQLGVGTWFWPSEQTMKITARDPLVLEVAAARVQALVDDEEAAAVFTVELADRRAETLHVFVDNSNVVISAQILPVPGGRAGETRRDCGIRVSTRELDRVVRCGRVAQQAVAFGSTPPRNNAIWGAWRNANYEVHLGERPPGGGEQFVDDALIAQMQRALLDYPRGGRTMVLVSGDGNDNHGRASFLSVVGNALQMGWNVEVWSWRCSCSRRYRELQAVYGGQGVFKLFFLDNVREQVTFMSRAAPRGPGSGPGSGPGTPPAPRQAAAVPAVPAIGNGTLGSGGGSSGAGSGITAGAAAAEEKEEEEDVGWMNCPITLEPILVPVRLPTTAYHFERDSLARWVEQHGSCPLTCSPVALVDLLPAEPEFRARLAAYWPLEAQAESNAVSNAVEPPVVEPTPASNAPPFARPGNFRTVPCRYLGRCRMLTHPEGCAFKHTPEELAAARHGGGGGGEGGGRFDSGFWRCPACGFVNRPQSSTCGGVHHGPGPRRFGCGAPR